MKSRTSNLYRSLRSVALAALVAGLLVAGALAQNPVPQIVGPPHPIAVAPGGGDFTLNVYGANFVPGAVVNWNRQARSTTYISARELQAQILASDIVAATAGYITVTNPPPGGGNSSSSWSLVEVHTPTAMIMPGYETQNRENNSSVYALLVADFNNDGIPDLATGTGIINVSLGDGDGGFRWASNATYIYLPISGGNSMAYGDFNGDGNLDLAFTTVYGVHGANAGMGVNLGNGDGTFDPIWQFTNTASTAVGGVVAGDFNRDGKLDLIGETYLFLGNGDGTFQLTTTSAAVGGVYLAVGDFNGDGILDLASFGNAPPKSPISIAFGNGDGTFQTAATVGYSNGSCAFGAPMLTSDFNGDGKLDIAFCNQTSIGVLLGNGDGTFQKPKYYYVGTASAFSFAAGDFNSDGKTDLIVSDYNHGLFLILLGNGDGTFQPRSQVKLPGPPNQGGEQGMVTGDFNSDGLLDFIFQLDAVGIGEYLQK